MINDELFDAYKPELTERFIRHARLTLEDIKADLGPDMKGIYNSWTWVKTFNKVVKPFFNIRDKSLNADKLAAGAEQYATDTVNAWKAKVAEKMGMLDTGSKLHHLNGADFCITGTKNGEDVSISQQMIINVSSAGTLFNQFPARIALNGKAISAAKFKKHFV